MAGVFSWYAVYTAPRAEKKIKERLDTEGIQNYLPLRKEYRQWSDRRKKVVVPLISGYIFVYILRNSFSTVLTLPGVVSFLKEGGKPIAIPEKQIERLHFVEHHYEEPLEMTYENIPVGSLVEITQGNLHGFYGEMVEYRNKYRLVLRLDQLGCALVTIPINWIKKI